MQHINASPRGHQRHGSTRARGRRVAGLAAMVCALLMQGCYFGYVYVDEDYRILRLGLTVTRTGPAEVQADWSGDSLAAIYLVRRDGTDLARATTLTLIDQSVLPGARPCYEVFGLDRFDRVVSRSDVVCVVQ
jgi:hypothetical protein